MALLLGSTCTFAFPCAAACLFSALKSLGSGSGSFEQVLDLWYRPKVNNKGPRLDGWHNHTLHVSPLRKCQWRRIICYASVLLKGPKQIKHLDDATSGSNIGPADALQLLIPGLADEV
ncbi:hypothetical protein BDP55DRAFT_67503 [Colletotrichum godetiae]|uniref:Secreted protein n=1 Tax=Colletotrichum godetiae TaxID=1209918 RepID=A0AAJ0AQ87_9PEZI|nr:uncharacterized protein BDP55DRAFT_67503 [Colletotrichum godetiae]KAK1688371.1 hypothetical protein BDP55DRAFT_67503 [Colletotrichum godetiae]